MEMESVLVEKLPFYHKESDSRDACGLPKDPDELLKAFNFLVEKMNRIGSEGRISRTVQLVENDLIEDAMLRRVFVFLMVSGKNPFKSKLSEFDHLEENCFVACGLDQHKEDIAVIKDWLNTSMPGLKKSKMVDLVEDAMQHDPLIRRYLSYKLVTGTELFKRFL